METTNEKFKIEGWEIEHEARKLGERIRWFFILFICLLMLLGLGSLCHAYMLDELVTAIGKAENSKSHPYGVMVKYRHTSPKQACLNTIKHQYRLWLESGRKQAFVAFLSLSYSPIGASNDPQGLNKNWTRNVSYFLKEGI